MIKTVLITGASGGIGAEIAYRYAGCTLLLMGRDVGKLTAVADKCRSMGSPTVEIASIDVCDGQSMEAWIVEMDSKYNIDMVVANAGIVADFDINYSFNAVMETINTNICGVINTIQPCINAMQERRYGHVVLISSVAGFAPATNMFDKATAAYSMSKRFVTVYGEGIRCLYSENGVRVHVICPGFIDTPLLKDISSDLQRSKIKIEHPKKVADAISWAIFSNSPLVVVPLVSTLLYGVLMPFIPLTLYTVLAPIAIRYKLGTRAAPSEIMRKPIQKIPTSILITGASSGLGAALAREYAAHGVSMALFGRDKKRLKATAIACEEKMAKVSTYSIDILDLKNMEKAIQECNNGKALDLVIANAGVSGGVARQHIEDTQQIMHIVRVNITGTLNTIEPAIREMKKRRNGQIIIICSFLALRGVPGQPTYCATKAALLSYGTSLRMELAAYNIGVTMVCCGYLRTPMSEGNPLRWSAISPDSCARSIRIGAAHNRCVIHSPLYMSACMILMNALLPRRLTDFIITRFFPRRQPMRKTR